MTFWQHLALNAGLLWAYMSIWWLIGRRLKRLDVADTAWGGGFILVALASWLTNPNFLTSLIAILVLAWGLRLMSHIWRRSRAKSHDDPRYQELSAKWGRNFWLRAYVAVFMLQGLLLLLVSMPITAAAAQSQTPSTMIAIIGVVVWLAGFNIESAADRQLAEFVANPANKGKIMGSGLWRYSRHPNYFGEIMQWWGVWVLTLGGLWWAAIVGPITITWLIVFVSGIPLLERRYRSNRDYQNYSKRTSMLVPLPPRIRTD